ncbi:MAG: hypothetical protein ABR985_18880 [Methanotrichaceae archaeon]|jgi:hypothetical protein
MTDKKKYPVDEIETMKGEAQKEAVSDIKNGTCLAPPESLA